ncbi:FUSC family protein [Nocardia sp. ET3-3]|uniref:FUSC family protein n=1 Tax=Nocardia terrae TaxID=2675851 RepID=A0A7K1V469_9NOCA|nr:FUSC family protein [Nocardia terrae]MVU81443.1 FUSC family protein [Nocardia terrae]
MIAEPDSLGESPPPVARRRNLLLKLAPGGWRWDAGLRTALAFGIPAGLLVACGRASWALFVCFGAFAVMYGEGRAYRVRWRVISIAGAALLGCVGVGIAVGANLPPAMAAWPVEIVVLTAIGVAGVYVIDAARLGPPGVMFFLVACSGALVAARSGIAAGGILIATALGVAGALVVSMAGRLIARDQPERLAVALAVREVDGYVGDHERGTASAARRHRAGEALWNAWATVHDAGLPEGESPLVAELLAAHERLAATAPVEDDEAPGEDADPQGIPLARPTLGHRLRRSLNWSSHATVTSVRVLCACVAAGTVGGLIGSTRPHWAILTALIILQAGPDRVHGSARAVNRLIGTALGLGVFAALVQLRPSGFALVAVLAVLQFGVELFITRNYSLAAIFFTPVALLAGGAGAGGQAVGAVMRDRLGETAIGVVIALLALRFLLPDAHRRTLGWVDRRVRDGAQRLLDRLRTDPVDAPAAMALRQDLQFELIGAMRAGVDSAHNDPGWTRPLWPAHARLQHAGYDLLAQCRTAGSGTRLPGIDRWERAFARPLG